MSNVLVIERKRVVVEKKELVIPSWVRYITQDHSGEWHGFSCMPYNRDSTGGFDWYLDEDAEGAHEVMHEFEVYTSTPRAEDNVVWEIYYE